MQHGQPSSCHRGRCRNATAPRNSTDPRHRYNPPKSDAPFPEESRCHAPWLQASANSRLPGDTGRPWVAPKSGPAAVSGQSEVPRTFFSGWAQVVGGTYLGWVAPGAGRVWKGVSGGLCRLG